MRVIIAGPALGHTSLESGSRFEIEAPGSTISCGAGADRRQHLVAAAARRESKHRQVARGLALPCALSFRAP
jgi:hypothetical protein